MMKIDIALDRKKYTSETMSRDIVGEARSGPHSHWSGARRGVVRGEGGDGGLVRFINIVGGMWLRILLPL